MMLLLEFTVALFNLKRLTKKILPTTAIAILTSIDIDVNNKVFLWMLVC